MAAELIHLLAPDATALLAAVAADLAVGDPVFRWHPIRLLGDALNAFERALRTIGWDGYGGGIILFVLLAALSLAALAAAMFAALALTAWLAWLLHVVLLYVMLALGDLLRHVWAVECAATSGDLGATRHAIARLVARDTDRMDIGGCRRAAIESLSENLPDGFVSAVLWYALLGLPGLVVFKIASTMDSMVGYRTPRYLRFGWCGARLDDVMNYVPARLSWALIAAIAAVVPGCSARKAWLVGWWQHGLFPSPNSGWSEAAMAGAIQRRLVGAIWKQGELIIDVWIGDSTDPVAQTRRDVRLAIVVAVAAGLLATALAAGLLLVAR